MLIIQELVKIEENAVVVCYTGLDIATSSSVVSEE